MATEQKTKAQESQVEAPSNGVETYVLKYDTGTYYAYLADGGLRKEDRDELAERHGNASADSLDFRVVEDSAGHALKVEVSAKK